jgi:hypothetical protein
MAAADNARSELLSRRMGGRTLLTALAYLAVIATVDVYHWQTFDGTAIGPAPRPGWGWRSRSRRSRSVT